MVKIPEINFDALNRELDGVVQRANISSLLPKAQESAKQFRALKDSKLATEVGQTAAGFESLTSELDDIEGLEEVDKVASQGVALLTQNAPGLKSIVTDTPSSNSDLETLTEGSVGGGLLDFKVTAPTPEAMSKALQDLTDEPLNKISSSLSGVTSQDLSSLTTSLNNVVGKGLTVGEGFLNEVTKFASGLEAEINNVANGFTGQLKNLTEQFNGQLGPTLNKITAGVNLPNNVKPNVAQLLEQGKIAEAGQLLERYSSLSTAEIESILGNIPVTMSEKVAKNKPLNAKTTRSTII